MDDRAGNPVYGAWPGWSGQGNRQTSGGGYFGGVRGFGLGWVARVADRRQVMRFGSAAMLLHRVRQLVGEQPAACREADVALERARSRRPGIWSEISSAWIWMSSKPVLGSGSRSARSAGLSGSPVARSSRETGFRWPAGVSRS